MTTLVALFIVILCVLTHGGELSADETRSEYEHFLREFGKEHHHLNDTRRVAQFHRSHTLVKEHNTKHYDLSKGRPAFTIKLNSMSDLLPEEIQQQFGFQESIHKQAPDKPPKRHKAKRRHLSDQSQRGYRSNYYPFFPWNGDKDLVAVDEGPNSIDWSTHNNPLGSSVMSAVRNQVMSTMLLLQYITMCTQWNALQHVLLRLIVLVIPLLTTQNHIQSCIVLVYAHHVVIKYALFDNTHQGSCGACWAFVAVATVEAALRIALSTERTSGATHNMKGADIGTTENSYHHMYAVAAEVGENVQGIAIQSKRALDSASATVAESSPAGHDTPLSISEGSTDQITEQTSTSSARVAQQTLSGPPTPHAVPTVPSEPLVTSSMAWIPSLSVQQLVDCDTSFNRGCSGGSPLFAFHYIADNGLVPWSRYEYEEKVMCTQLFCCTVHDGTRALSQQSLWSRELKRHTIFYVY